MKLIADIHPDKLRGGYYTEAHVVDFCLDQIRRLAGGWPANWLEPSAGDGAFIRGMQRKIPSKALARMRVDGAELISEEAAKCAAIMREARLGGRIEPASFFEWAKDRREPADVVIGNPPFVRYQFVPEQDRAAAEDLVLRMGIQLHRVSNLWIPFALLSLDLLRKGGCFALVLPSELFCTVSGGQFREYLIRQFTALSIDLFPRGTFADILQDVAVVSGRRAVRSADARTVSFSEHDVNGVTRWRHRVEATPESWTRYLITEREYSAFCEARSLRGVCGLGSLAKLEVAIVTGANPFFTIDDATMDRYQLGPWAIPLLARTADCPGVIFNESDHVAARGRGSRAWLLDFSDARPVPNGKGRVSEYLALGEAQDLPSRYKCRIRTPWFRVPHIKRGTIMMTKRAHHYHRLLLNSAGVYTTDTIYRGVMYPLNAGREADLVATFQNTLTLLSTEIEGRTYGGGVLELVPSEVSRLAVPFVASNGLLEQVDEVSRSVSGQRDPTHAVMRLIDDHLAKIMPEYGHLLPLLDSARRRLQARRQSAA